MSFLAHVLLNYEKTESKTQNWEPMFSSQCNFNLIATYPDKTDEKFSEIDSF